MTFLAPLSPQALAWVISNMTKEKSLGTSGPRPAYGTLTLLIVLVNEVRIGDVEYTVVGKQSVGESDQNLGHVRLGV